MKSEIPSNVIAYLEKKCEKKWLSYDIERKFKTVVVVPAIKEFNNIAKLLNSLAKNSVQAKEEALILFSINNSIERQVDVLENNRRTIKYLSELIEDNNFGLNINFIDASSTGKELPSKDAGVGLARKIGMDQSLLYFDYNCDDNIIVCLDADCKVESNYLEEIRVKAKEGISAGVIKYEHQPDNEAIVNYEIFLRYYVLGLKIAESPYAYHSIGSCMVVNPMTYVKIGGMNKKKAGEDFYFLEKAAKHVMVSPIDKTTVIPSSRKSWRVPFGTGQRMTRFYERVRDEYVLYDPKSFVILKDFLKFYFESPRQSPQTILSNAKIISESLYSFLIENNFKSAQQKILENSKTSTQLNHQKKLWFDSFRTLKLIHYLRDNGYPEKTMFSALNETFDLTDINHFEKYTSNNLPSLEKQIEYLSILRKLT